MSPFLRVLENEVQVAALAFLALVYGVRIVWLFRFKKETERTWAAGSAAKGVAYSLLNVAMPWAMESTRKNPWLYAQFVVFHVGIAAAISATFIIPYAPHLFREKAIVIIFQVLIGAALLAGLMRLYRRLSNPAIRIISTADDFMSILLMILYFAAGVLAVPNAYEKEEWPLVLFFGLTAFLLAYVPFSKVGHYLYYPFSRYFLGKALGRRGAFPPRRGAVVKSPESAGRMGANETAGKGSGS